MSDTTTQDYANRVADGIRKDCVNETPFGVRDELTHGGNCGYEVTELEPGAWYCAECDEELEAHEVDGVLSAWDYLDDVLDWRYTIERDGSYRSAEIAITLGGPNVWIHTGSNELHVYWGGDHVVRTLPSEFTDALDEVLEEWYGSTR